MTNDPNNPSDESTIEFPTAEEIDSIVGQSAQADNDETAQDSVASSAASTVDSSTVDTSQPTDEVAELKQKLADAEKQALLAHAELDNFRRRNIRESQDKIRYASSGLMTDILEAVDNLGRAVESYDKDGNGDGLNDGVKMVADQITSVLEKHGCKKIDSVGHTFDPNLHQALQMQPSDQFDANVVMTDLRPGFQLHERVLRPSQVFVSTGPANE